MKKLLIALAALPFMASAAAAGQPLSDQQLDRVTAGLTLPTDCPGCTPSSSGSSGNTPGGGAITPTGSIGLRIPVMADRHSI